MLKINKYKMDCVVTFCMEEFKMCLYHSEENLQKWVSTIFLSVVNVAWLLRTLGLQIVNESDKWEIKEWGRR